MDDFRVKFTGKPPKHPFTPDEREAILLRGKKPVGNCNWQIPEPGRLHINWFEIDGPYRHRGYGRALWSLLERKFQRYYRAERITLFYKDKRARLFWKAVGFKHDKSGEDGDAFKLLPTRPSISTKSLYLPKPGRSGNIKPLPSK